MIDDNNRIETISNKKNNVIERIVPEGLLVTTDKGRLQLVRKEWIEDAWLALARKRRIVADDILAEPDIGLLLSWLCFPGWIVLKRRAGRIGCILIIKF